MVKIAFIGAGSFGFTRGLVRDMLSLPLFEDAEFALMDIHEGRLEMSRQACQKLVDASGKPAKVTATLDRKKALMDADAVLVTILSGSTDVWQHDILIPKKYGVDINIGDTRGPSGIFRALRTIPEMLNICRDMEELCPEAIMLNYTNPMAMLCHAMQRETRINVTGLCHSVQGTAEMLARWCNVPIAEVDYVCAGINHLAWYLKFQHKGRDLYPELQRIVRENKDVYNEEQVRNEMFLAFDYYVTESSGHNSEYNWWFRKRPELIEKYCTHGTNWNPGHYAYILNSYKEKESKWQEEFKAWIESPDWDDPVKRAERLKPGHEYAAFIVNSYIGDDFFRFNGNVPNTGLISNLPEGCCVEVPVIASRNSLQPMHVGALPSQVAPLVNLSAQIETMTVDAYLSGDARLVYQAIANDPLTAAVLSLREIKDMAKEMFEANKNHLPSFSRIEL